MTARAPNPAEGVWQRFHGHRQSTAEIARRTGQPEQWVDRIVAACMQARFTRQPMPWREGG